MYLSSKKKSKIVPANESGRAKVNFPTFKGLKGADVKFFGICAALMLVVVASALIFYGCQKEAEKYSTSEGYSTTTERQNAIHKELVLVGWQIIEPYIDSECNCPGTRVIFICTACQEPGYIPPTGAKEVWEECATGGGNGSNTWREMMANSSILNPLAQLNKMPITEQQSFVASYRESFIEVIATDLIDKVIIGDYYISSATKTVVNDDIFRYSVCFSNITNGDIVTIVSISFIYEGN